MPNLPTVQAVDDEVRSQEALRRTLENEFTIFTASGAEEALALLEHEWVHVIQCEQRMPGMTHRRSNPDIAGIGVLAALVRGEELRRDMG